MTDSIKLEDTTQNTQTSFPSPLVSSRASISSMRGSSTRSTRGQTTKKESTSPPPLPTIPSSQTVTRSRQNSGAHPELQIQIPLPRSSPLPPVKHESSSSSGSKSEASSDPDSQSQSRSQSYIDEQDARDAVSALAAASNAIHTTKAPRNKRRRVEDISEHEIWKCSFDGCTKIYKRTSTISINNHRNICKFRPIRPPMVQYAPGMNMLPNFLPPSAGYGMQNQYGMTNMMMQPQQMMMQQQPPPSYAPYGGPHPPSMMPGSFQQQQQQHQLHFQQMQQHQLQQQQQQYSGYMTDGYLPPQQQQSLIMQQQGYTPAPYVSPQTLAPSLQHSNSYGSYPMTSPSMLSNLPLATPTTTMLPSSLSSSLQGMSGQTGEQSPMALVHSSSLSQQDSLRLSQQTPLQQHLAQQQDITMQDASSYQPMQLSSDSLVLPSMPSLPGQTPTSMLPAPLGGSQGNSSGDDSSASPLSKEDAAGVNDKLQQALQLAKLNAALLEHVKQNQQAQIHLQQQQKILEQQQVELQRQQQQFHQQGQATSIQSQQQQPSYNQLQSSHHPQQSQAQFHLNSSPPQAYPGQTQLHSPSPSQLLPQQPSSQMSQLLTPSMTQFQLTPPSLIPVAPASQAHTPVGTNGDQSLLSYQYSPSSNLMAGVCGNSPGSILNGGGFLASPPALPVLPSSMLSPLGSTGSPPGGPGHSLPSPGSFLAPHLQTTPPFITNTLGQVSNSNSPPNSAGASTTPGSSTLSQAGSNASGVAGNSTSVAPMLPANNTGSVSTGAPPPRPPKQLGSPSFASQFGVPLSSPPTPLSGSDQRSVSQGISPMSAPFSTPSPGAWGAWKVVHAPSNGKSPSSSSSTHSPGQQGGSGASSVSGVGGGSGPASLTNSGATSPAPSSSSNTSVTGMLSPSMQFGQLPSPSTGSMMIVSPKQHMLSLPISTPPQSTHELWLDHMRNRMETLRAGDQAVLMKQTSFNGSQVVGGEIPPSEKTPELPTAPTLQAGLTEGAPSAAVLASAAKLQHAALHSTHVPLHPAPSTSALARLSTAQQTAASLHGMHPVPGGTATTPPLTNGSLQRYGSNPSTNDAVLSPPTSTSTLPPTAPPAAKV